MSSAGLAGQLLLMQAGAEWVLNGVAWGGVEKHQAVAARWHVHWLDGEVHVPRRWQHEKCIRQCSSPRICWSSVLLASCDWLRDALSFIINAA